MRPAGELVLEGRVVHGRPTHDDWIIHWPRRLTDLKVPESFGHHPGERIELTSQAYGSGRSAGKLYIVWPRFLFSMDAEVPLF